MRKAYYIAVGPVRGACGHKHRSPEAAARCAVGDGRAIRRRYPGTPGNAAYSDRGVHAVEDGVERALHDWEMDAVAAEERRAEGN